MAICGTSAARRSPLSSGPSWASRRPSSRSSMSTAVSCSRCSSAATRRARCATTSCNAFTRWPKGSRPPARRSRSVLSAPGDDHAAKNAERYDPLVWRGRRGHPAAREAALSGGHFDDGLKERVALRLERVEAAMSRQIARGTGVLATIGATAPFVGLFGTVWGIMNSFIGISEAHTTNLAVVAPGIAEALLATALGLVAAIPAVVIYNHLTRTIAAHRALLGDASAMVLLLISREGDRGAFRLARAAE